MMKRLFAKAAPLAMGVWTLAAVPMLWNGCGGDEYASQLDELTETKAAQINQADLNKFTDSIKLKNCTFSVAGGTGTFTPSNELAGVLYGDPNGAAHKSTFAVPVITTPDATFEIKTLDADMVNTGVTLSGTNLTVKLAFKALLHFSVKAGGLGTLPADIEVRPSSLAVALSYDTATERAKVASVTATIDTKTKNCGGSGWCNGIVDGILKSNLKKWIEPPLRDALAKALDSASVTSALYDGMGIMYNLKDPKATKWTTVAHSLTLTGGAFNFKVERP